MLLNPEDINTEITPREFELLVKEYLDNLGKELKTFKTTHNINLKRNDGEYQIDVFAEFEYLGVDFKILVECKRHKSSIKREVVQLLYDKLRTTGAQKGIIFSTSGFQEGAHIFAEEHGIALIRVIEGRYTYYTKSSDSQQYNPPPWIDLSKFVGEFKNGNTTTNLQKGYFESLEKFIFDDK